MLPIQLPRRFFGTCRDVDEFEKIKRVGEGTYGIVYCAKDRKSGSIVALKKIRLEDENEGMPISALREIALLKSLNHVNIVQIHDVVVGKDLGLSYFKFITF